MSELGSGTDAPPPPPPPPPPDTESREPTPDASPELANALARENQAGGQSGSDGASQDALAMAPEQAEPAGNELQAPLNGNAVEGGPSDVSPELAQALPPESDPLATASAVPDQVVESDAAQDQGQDSPQTVADGEQPLPPDPVAAEELADLQPEPDEVGSEPDAADTITPEPAEPAPDNPPEPAPDNAPELEPEPVAADLEGSAPVGWTDNATVQEAFDDAALDPATADLVAGSDPLGGMPPAEYQAEYWDPTASTPYGQGDWAYPEHDGADLSAPVTTKTFVPGETFDRFGPESGNYASPEGTPWTDRSLPPTSLVSPSGDSTYHVYEVTDKWATDPPPVVVTESTVAPDFGQRGGGVQYKFEAAPDSSEKMSFGWLLDHGYITEVSP